MLTDELEESLLPASLDVTLSVDSRLKAMRSVLEVPPPQRSASLRSRSSGVQSVKVHPAVTKHGENLLFFAWEIFCHRAMLLRNLFCSDDKKSLMACVEQGDQFSF